MSVFAKLSKQLIIPYRSRRNEAIISHCHCGVLSSREDPGWTNRMSLLDYCIVTGFVNKKGCRILNQPEFSYSIWPAYMTEPVKKIFLIFSTMAGNTVKNALKITTKRSKFITKQKMFILPSVILQIFHNITLS